MEGLNTELKPVELNGAEGQKSWTEISFSGRIEASTIDTFMEAFDSQLNQNQKFIILNMDNVDYITSTGLGGLIKYHNVFEEKGGRMIMLEPPEAVMGVLSLLGFQDVLHIFDSYDDISKNVDFSETEKEENKEETVILEEGAIFNPADTFKSENQEESKVEAIDHLDIETFEGKSNSDGLELPNAAVAVEMKKTAKARQDDQPKDSERTKAVSKEKKITPDTPTAKKKTPEDKSGDRRAPKDRRKSDDRRGQITKTTQDQIDIGEPIRQKATPTPDQSKRKKIKRSESQRVAKAEPQKKRKASTKSKVNHAKLKLEIDQLEDDYSSTDLTIAILVCLGVISLSAAGFFCYYHFSPQPSDFKLKIITLVCTGVVIPAILVYLGIKVLSHKRKKAKS